MRRMIAGSLFSLMSAVGWDKVSIHGIEVDLSDLLTI